MIYKEEMYLTVTQWPSCLSLWQVNTATPSCFTCVLRGQMQVVILVQQIFLSTEPSLWSLDFDFFLNILCEKHTPAPWILASSEGKLGLLQLWHLPYFCVLPSVTWPGYSLTHGSVKTSGRWKDWGLRDCHNLWGSAGGPLLSLGVIMPCSPSWLLKLLVPLHLQTLVSGIFFTFMQIHNWN